MPPAATTPNPRPRWHFVLEGLAIVVGYYLLVRLQFRYSPPPAGISPIWLPAGAAFAVVLLRGWWTTVPLTIAVVGEKLLGDLLLDPHTELDGSLTPVLEVGAATFVYAVGVVGQAIVGAWLVRRGLRTSRIEDGRDAAWFLLAAGPISCLVIAVFGTVSFIMDGIVDREAALSSALTFWVGDSIGCMVVGTAAVALTGGDHWRQRRYALLFLAIATTVAVVGATQVVGQNQTRQLRDSFETSSSRAYERIDRDIARSANAARTLAAQASAVGSLDGGWFSVATDATLDRLGYLGSMDVRVVHARPYGDANRPPDTIPVSHQSTFDRARDEGDVAWLDSTRRSRPFVVAPAYERPLSANARVGTRRAALIGWVVADVPLDAIAGRAFEDIDEERVSAAMYRMVDDRAQLVGAAPPRDNPLVEEGESPLDRAEATDAAFTYDRELEVGGAGSSPWRLAVAASSVWVSERELLSAVLPVALMCMAFTFTVMMLGLTSTGQRARLARLVEARTEQLRASELRYRSVVNSVRDAIFRIDEDDRIVFMNDAWTGTGLAGIGTPRLGLPVVEALSIDRPERLVELLAEARRAPGQVVRGDVQSIDGTRHWELRLAAEVPANGAEDDADTVPGIVGVVSDVTEHRAVLSNRERFVSFIAHELRNPLTVISGAISTIDRHDGDALPPTATTLMPVLRSSAARLERIIADLLVASQVDAGTLRLHPTDADLRAVVAEAMAEVDLLARDQGITVVRREGFDNGSAIGSFDVSRITQVVDNLLSNAIKYPPRGGTVTVDVEADGESIAARISDTGIGMTADEQERVFDRFARTEAGAAVATGTGLGLSICLGIARAHGGRIDVASEVGQGSTFTLVLPSEHADDH